MKFLVASVLAFWQWSIWAAPVTKDSGTTFDLEWDDSTTELAQAVTSAIDDFVTFETLDEVVDFNNETDDIITQFEEAHVSDVTAVEPEVTSSGSDTIDFDANEEEIQMGSAVFESTVLELIDETTTAPDFETSQDEFTLQTQDSVQSTTWSTETEQEPVTAPADTFKKPSADSASRRKSTFFSWFSSSLSLSSSSTSPLYSAAFRRKMYELEQDASSTLFDYVSCTLFLLIIQNTQFTYIHIRFVVVVYLRISIKKP